MGDGVAGEHCLASQVAETNEPAADSGFGGRALWKVLEAEAGNQSNDQYWCYYANVVRYLEKVEALFVPKTRGPAYLVWTDDDGPHMIAGPGIHWYRGDGPMPDLDALEIPVSITAPIGAARVSKRLATSALSTRTRRNTPRTLSKRSPANAQSTRPARECRPTTPRKAPACRLQPPAHHNPETSIKPAIQPQKRRTKGEQLFRNPLKPAHNRTRPADVRGKTSRRPISFSLRRFRHSDWKQEGSTNENRMAVPLF